MPVDFLTTEQTESYGRFTGEPDELQLARYFHLDEADKEFIGKSRGDHNRLGIALQIGCVRFLGTFLTDMNNIPSGVRHFIARQLAIHDITVLAEYGQRENTRREHAALIRQHYDYREFAWPWTFRLTRLLYTRSWISNERPGLLFDLATGWLMQHRIILPGATTLTRLISEVREKATLRLWNRLAMIPSAMQRSQLETLLGSADSGRLSLLESLKKGPVTISGPAFNEAIDRWKMLSDFGLNNESLNAIPTVRLKNLARYAGMTSVFNIAMLLALVTAQRPSDLVRMHSDHIYDGLLHVVQFKTGERIALPTALRLDETGTSIQDVIDICPAGYLLQNSRGQPVNTWSLSRWFRICREQAGITSMAGKPPPFKEQRSLSEGVWGAVEPKRRLIGSIEWSITGKSICWGSWLGD